MTTKDNKHKVPRSEKMIQRHNKMVKACLKVADDMIQTGVKQWKADFYNGFRISILDLKSSKFRSKTLQKESNTNG